MSTKKSEGGVEMVELALILPILILICFGVVDLLRISHFEAMLKRAAYDIAVKARTAPNLDYDLRRFTMNNGEYYDFRESRGRAIEAGLASAKTSFTQPGVASDAQLIAVTQVDDSLGNYDGSPPPPFTSAAAILRPGEQATFTYTDSSGEVINEVVKHPLLPPHPDGKVPPQEMETLLTLSPIHVEVRALVHPLLYFALGDRIVRASTTTYQQMGIRRTIMRDSSGNDIAPSTATRKGKGSDEVWLTSPEPEEPVVTCTAAPLSWSARWAFAFGQSTVFGEPWVVNTKEPGTGVCPIVSIADVGAFGL